MVWAKERGLLEQVLVPMARLQMSQCAPSLVSSPQLSSPVVVSLLFWLYFIPLVKTTSFEARK